MDYRKRKSTKCRNINCICWNCKHKKATSLTKCENGNCRYCDHEYPNDTRECVYFERKDMAQTHEKAVIC